MVFHIAGGFWDDGILDADPTIRVIEGDVNNISLVDTAADGGRLITKKGWSVGRPMLVEGMPTKVEREGCSVEERPLLDVESFYGQFLVNDQFKGIVEKLEPETHQFFPMELFVSGELQRVDYFFNICSRLDTIDKDNSFPINERGFWSPVGREPAALVFSTEKIGNHHAWRDKFTQGAFISNVLASALRDAGISGLSYKEYEEV